MQKLTTLEPKETDSVSTYCIYLHNNTMQPHCIQVIVLVVLWISRVYGYCTLHECGIMHGIPEGAA